MKNMKITIGHFFASIMNTYGDDGNIIALKKRCEWRGIDVEVKEITYIQKIDPGEFDLYFFGGGQDQAQMLIAKDLVNNHKGEQFQKDIEKGIPMLCICGGYQLMGEYYQPFEGEKLPGVGIFPAYTKASLNRMIGNIAIDLTDSDLKLAESYGYEPDTNRKLGANLVGFENHSGKTFLKKGATPLGKVIKGFGNNGEDKTEGCIYKNAIGCYMHGSLLPKNPHLTDWLIKKALEVKYQKEIQLEPLYDYLENEAHKSIVKRLEK
jgi:lipid II isoglutaminyl synthase (glutamine-hydrolysing)